MKKIIVLLCLGLIGCYTVPEKKQTTPPSTAAEKQVISASPAGQLAKKEPLYSEKEIDDIITVFSEAIKKDPNYGGGYYNRAIAYFYYQNNYDKCWQDVYRAEALGYSFNNKFLKELRKASGRQR